MKGFDDLKKHRTRCTDCKFTFSTVGSPTMCPKCGKNLCGCNDCTAPYRICNFKGYCRIERQNLLLEIGA